MAYSPEASPQSTLDKSDDDAVVCNLADDDVELHTMQCDVPLIQAEIEEYENMTPCPEKLEANAESSC